MNFNNLKFHELANLFPLLQDEELQKIVDDINANGFRASEPITLLGVKILDGRNRYNAAKLAGYKLQPDNVEHFKERYPGQDPLAFVLAKNLHRRHLTIGQRACFAAELYKRMKKRPVGQPKEISGIQDNTPIAKESLKKAAQMAGVGVDSVQHALRIEKVAPDLAAEVKAGKITLQKASQEVKRREVMNGTAQQRAIKFWSMPGFFMDPAYLDQIMSDSTDEKLLELAVKFKNQFLNLGKITEKVHAQAAKSKHPQLLSHVFDQNFMRYLLPSVNRSIDSLVEPLHYDLGINLYSQLREVERCLDRYRPITGSGDALDCFDSPIQTGTSLD
jgi:hypothetical protein